MVSMDCSVRQTISLGPGRGNVDMVFPKSAMPVVQVALTIGEDLLAIR